MGGSDLHRLPRLVDQLAILTAEVAETEEVASHGVGPLRTG